MSDPVVACTQFKNASSLLFINQSLVLFFQEARRLIDKVPYRLVVLLFILLQRGIFPLMMMRMK